MRVTLMDPDQVLRPVEHERLKVQLRYRWVGSGLELRRVALRVYCLAGRRGLEYACQLRIEVEPPGLPLVVEAASPLRRDCVKDALSGMDRLLKRQRSRFAWPLSFWRRAPRPARRGVSGRWGQSGRVISSG